MMMMLVAGSIAMQIFTRPISSQVAMQLLIQLATDIDGDGDGEGEEYHDDDDDGDDDDDIHP